MGRKIKVYSSTIRLFFAICSLFILSGCDEPTQAEKDRLAKTVVFYYDQTNNFNAFDFGGDGFIWVVGDTRNSARGVMAGSDSTTGLWIIFHICEVQNNDSKAEPFDYDVHKFYIEYGARRYYYTKSMAGTYTSYPDALRSVPTTDEIVEPKFYNATFLGLEKMRIGTGTPTTVDLRFAICVTIPKGTELIPDDELFPLFYDDNSRVFLCKSRNQEPVSKTPTISRDLLPECRPASIR